MRWTALGHAMGWVEAEGFRILFDPQLSGSHHQGLFRVFPERHFARELQPDLVVVSHRHPDHFDVASLARLGKRNPVLVTPDLFVGQVAERLGFSVCILRNYEPLRLDGLTLLPTPSFCKVVEWGMMLHSRRGWLWNQVDTELQSPERVAEVLGRARAVLGAKGAPDLAIVRWQPLHEVEPVLGGAMGFPLRDWERQLQLAVATGAQNFITGSAGFAYARGRGWQDHSTFPGTEAMFARDLRALRPEATVWEARVGAVWELDGGVREGE
ncbi:MAG TPA: MBL fold metallo-hydrolase, partial [Myxococcota bacterium]|nr:MBL fold metallo-hydrolase [Myxococcota bacterium]